MHLEMNQTQLYVFLLNFCQLTNNNSYNVSGNLTYLLQILVFFTYFASELTFPKVSSIGSDPRWISITYTKYKN